MTPIIYLEIYKCQLLPLCNFLKQKEEFGDATLGSLETNETVLQGVHERAITIREIE